MSSNRKTRYTGSLNYTKPVTRGPRTVLTSDLSYVAAESACDPRGSHMSGCHVGPSLSPLLSLPLSLSHFAPRLVADDSNAARLGTAPMRMGLSPGANRASRRRAPPCVRRRRERERELQPSIVVSSSLTEADGEKWERRRSGGR
jgi:hypothetical protein